MDEDFLAIGHTMEELVDDPVDCYWLVKNFVNQFHHKFGDSIPHLVSMPTLMSVHLHKPALLPLWCTYLKWASTVEPVQ